MNEPTDFEDLKAFILDRARMRMTHIYKPVMLQAMLRRGGSATKNEIAGEIMSRDELQIEHYRRNVVHQMPGQRLVRDGIVEQHEDRYRLKPPFDIPSEWQRLELIAVCERRIEEHRAVYGDLFAKRTVDAVNGSVHLYGDLLLPEVTERLLESRDEFLLSTISNATELRCATSYFFGFV